MKTQMWTTGPLPPDVQASLARLERLPDVQRVAVMPDVHLGHDVCIGAVLATRRTLYPGAIGADIGCGISTLRFDGPAAAVHDKAEQLLRGFERLVPILRHRQRQPLPPALQGQLSPQLSRAREREGRLQLGTVGRGNHFVELQSDPQGALWLTVHTGSRAMGPAVQRIHQTQGLAPLMEHDAAAFLRDHDWALAYARANRQAITVAAGAWIMAVLGFEPVEASLRECCHNMVVRERCGDSGTLWVHRKGAISAHLDQPGVIPGSMGASTFLVRGRGCAQALCSSSHGAGRKMSRGQARASISLRTLRRETSGVHLYRDHRLIEEAPGAYKDIHKVMRAQRELTRIETELRPVLNYKGA